MNKRVSLRLSGTLTHVVMGHKTVTLGQNIITSSTLTTGNPSPPSAMFTSLGLTERL